MREKVSVVVTVRNEERTVGMLIESILKQTRKASEVVMVDGGSGDRTVEIIKKYQKKSKEIRLIVEKGTIAHGRNTAVKRANNEIIAQIDGGCVAREDWLEKIVKPLEDQTVGLAAGFYEMTGEGDFQKVIRGYFGVTPEKYDEKSFMPSARSVAFRKKVWKEVGGYEEGLAGAGEDTLFNYRVLKEGIKTIRVKGAVVDWELPKTWGEAVRKWYGYAKGDGQALIWWHPAQRYATHTLKIWGVYVRYLIAVGLVIMGERENIYWYLLIFMGIIYAGWIIKKNRDAARDAGAILWLTGVQVSSDLAVMAGFLSGLVTRKRERFGI